MRTAEEIQRDLADVNAALEDLHEQIAALRYEQRSLRSELREAREAELTEFLARNPMLPGLGAAT